jgi:hypothetical protein
MAHRTLLLFQSHYLDARLERAFRRLVREAPAYFECRVLMHLPPGKPAPRRLSRVPHHLVRTDELRAMPYPRKTSAADWTGRAWHLWDGGHCDLIPLHLLRRAEFDHAWIIEYDVAFTGNWGRFFAAFEDSPADLIATSVRLRQADPHWVCWPSLQGGGILPEQAASAFLPLWRVSRRLVREMDAAYTAGFGGHLEASWATLAHARGMVLEDIGGEGPFVRPGNTRRFYTSSYSSAVQFYLAPGTFFAKPAMFRPGSRPNTLWHPVKPWHWRAEIAAGVKEWRIIAGAVRRALADKLVRRWRGQRRTDFTLDQG